MYGLLRNRLVTQSTIELPYVPDVLDGMTIMQLTDLHVRQPRRWHERFLREIAGHDIDVLLLTGDIGHRSCDEPAVVELLQRILRTVNCRIGAFGTFGNHDTDELRLRAGYTPAHWLRNQAWADEQWPLVVYGVDCNQQKGGGDLIAALLDEPEVSFAVQPLRIMLAHLPPWMLAAADAGVDLVFSGHTHGGQIRIPSNRIVFNATTGWPLDFTSGIMRKGHTYGVISRGLGETRIEGFRYFCPHQIPVITIHQARVPDSPTSRLECVTKW